MKVIFIPVFILRYLLRFACYLPLLVVLLGMLIRYAYRVIRYAYRVVSALACLCCSCRLSLVLLLILLYSSVVSSWCVRADLVELVEVSIYRYLLLLLVAVLSSAVGCVTSCGCIACLLSALWYPCRSCRSCGRLVVSSAVGRICCVLVVPVACRSSYRAWSGPRGPVGTLRRSTLRGG